MPVDPKKLKVGDKFFPPQDGRYAFPKQPRKIIRVREDAVVTDLVGDCYFDAIDYWRQCELVTDQIEKQQEMITNSLGGKQSNIGSRLDLLPPTATLAIGKVLDQGAKKYGDRNWRKVTIDEHLAHAIEHVYKYLQGDTAEDHLSHAATRMLFALEISKVGVETA